MATGEDRVAREGEDLLAIVLILLGEVRRTAAHGAGENRIADDGQWPAKARQVEGRHAGRVATREESLDRDRAEVEVSVFLEGFGALQRGGLELARPDLRLGFRGQSGEVGDVVVVSMGDENVAHRQALGVCEIEHRLAGGARIEGGGKFGASVPDEVAVDRHVLVGGVERREARGENRLLRVPALVGQRD